MNTDNDVNVSGLVSKLGLNRRQFLAATTGMAAAAAVTAPSGAAAPRRATACSSPPAKRGIILYTVRDAIGRDPGTSDLASGLQGGPRRAGEDRLQADRVRRLQPERQRPGWRNLNNVAGATLLRTLARRQRARGRGQPRQHPEHHHRRDDRVVRRRVRDRQHPRDGPHRHRQRPHRQRLRRRLGGSPPSAGTSSAQRARLARPEALHPQPRHRLQLPARQRPARRPRPPHPQQRHPPPRALPGQHRPGVRLPRDGHLLGPRRAVPAPHLHRPRRHPGAGRLRPGGDRRGADHAASRSSTPRTDAGTTPWPPATS